jgi:hypothetical protein
LPGIAGSQEAVVSLFKLIAAPLTLVLFGSLASEPAAAQQSPPAATPAPAAVPFTVQYDSRIEVRGDRTASNVTTARLKVLIPNVIGTVSQQRIVYIDGMQSLETVEAFTEKADGRQIAIDPADIITRDAASGLQSMFAPDVKERTLIFPDVQVGDTLVMTNRTETRQGLFPGQLIYERVFARSLPIADARIVIEAPRDLGLHVGTTGLGLTDRVEDDGAIRRHIVTLAPQPYQPEEVRAVAPVDRDPTLLISTFSSYEELGRAYAAAALPKITVTPEISALADQITSGITDRKQQAAAIDAWMKHNVRYVAVFLGTGRVVPNDAASVLRNRFGDCKDKVTLMASLLAAKGIKGEPALINAVGAYTLPDPPTMVVLNHVLLYLPEFDLYDDPTVAGAAFGVLAPDTYDKPVIRVSADGARLARTPEMKADDHVGRVRTTIKVAADGAVTGESETSSTGVFALALRSVVGAAQSSDGETAVRSMLQKLNTPGTGRIDLSRLADLADPIVVKGSFALTQPFKAPAPSERVALPVGLPLAARPGEFLFPGPFTGRKIAFLCYAGREIEDIDVTFDQALPMPVPVKPISIDNARFNFQASFKVEGRTLKIHREFTSHVAHQVCPAEADAEIGGDMRTINNYVRTTYIFTAAAPAPAGGGTQSQTVELTRAVAVGHKVQLDFLYSVNPDCTSLGFATVHVTEQPKHGKISVENGTGFTNFPQNNPRSDCNKTRSDGVIVAYEPEDGYTGQDSVNLEVIFASGSLSKRHYAVDVR